MITVLLGNRDLFQGYTGFPGGFLQHLFEHVYLHVPGTRTCRKISSVTQYFHGFLVYAFIALVGVICSSAALGKGRRIQDDQVIVSESDLIQVLKDIGFGKGHAFLKSVEFRVCLGLVQGNL